VAAAASTSSAHALQALPGDVLARVADHLASADHLVLQAASNRHMGQSIERHVLAANLEHRQAPAVHTLAQFTALLGHPGEGGGSVASLPPDLQAPALSALARRIPALPIHERGPANQAFLAFPYRGPRHPPLDELRRAAAQGDMGLVDRELALTLAGAAAHTAVSAGQHLGQVAAAHGIVGPEALGNLRVAALNHAQLEIAQGRHAPTTALAAGLDLAEDQALLNHFAAAAAGPAMVRRGIAPDAVITQLGIVGDLPQQAIRRAGAEHDVERGVEVHAAAARHGIVDDIGALEIRAAAYVGVGAVERGEGRLPAVAARLGIVSEVALDAFEALVVAGPGWRALQGNDDAPAVARRFGLQRPQSLARLAELQAWTQQREHHADAA
jgi:hypothetical protein